MKKYNIGLDFGTCQTKACLYHLDNELHEFFRFPDNGTFFLPSRIALKVDDTFEYGTKSETGMKKEFHYFKIAAAEDEEFVIETFDRPLQNNKSYNIKDFEPYTPEFLSVIYLTYVLFDIKESVRSQSTITKKGGGVLKRLFKTTQKPSEVRFTTQIGIPTEWSQIKNLRRKRKFENILMISELLQQKFGTKDSFVKAKSPELVKAVQDINKNNRLSGVSELNLRLNELGVSVFPETGAGLTFIVKTRQLLPGYYAIMDIGGGSTDISFFRVESGNYIKYLASESYIVAANNVYKHLASEDSIMSLQEAEKNVQQKLHSKEWENDDQLTKALISVNNTLRRLTYKLFNKRVYYFKNGLQNSYNEQPIILYGGGSKLPLINDGNILIHDNGIRVFSDKVLTTALEKQSIDRYTAIVNVLPADGSWKKDIALLIVALGLSYIKPDNFTDWFGEDEYQPKDGPRPRSDGLVPHPFNEDYLIYNVLASKWSKN